MKEHQMLLSQNVTRTPHGASRLTGSFVTRVPVVIVAAIAGLLFLSIAASACVGDGSQLPGQTSEADPPGGGEQPDPASDPNPNPEPDPEPEPDPDPEPEPDPDPEPDPQPDPNPEPDPGPSDQFEPNGDDDSAVWILVVVGGAVVLAIAGLFALIRSGGGSSGPAPASRWQTTTLTAYGQCVALHDSMSADLAAGGPAGVSTPESRARWVSSERRTTDLTAELNALAASAPDEESASAVRDLLVALAGLRSAVQAHTSVLGGGDGSPTDADVQGSESLVRQRLAEFDGATKAFRELI
jgi:hypothetical protein